MTYAAKGAKIFQSRHPRHPDCTPAVFRRSDHRLKSFESIVDMRAWDLCDQVRFAYFLELMSGSQTCLEDVADVSGGQQGNTGDGEDKKGRKGQKSRGDGGGRGKEGEPGTSGDRGSSRGRGRERTKSELENKVDELTEELNRSRDLLREAMRKLQNIDEIVTENKKLQGRLRVSEERVKFLEEKKKRLESELADLRSKSQIQMDLERAQEMLNKVTKQQEDPEGVGEAELRRLTAERDELQDKVRRLQKELEDSKKAEAEIEMLRNRSQSDSLDREEMTREYESYKKKLISMKCLEKQVQELKKQGRALADKYKRESQKAAEQMEKMHLAAKELQALQFERDSLRKRVNDLVSYESEYKKLQKKLQCVDSVIEENENLNSKLQALQKLEKENEFLRCKLESMQEMEMNAVEDKEKIMQLQCAVADQEEEMKELLCQIERLTSGRHEEELERLRCELYEKSSKLKLCEEQLAEIPMLEAEIDELRMKLKACCKEFSESKRGESKYQKVEIRFPCSSKEIQAKFKTQRSRCQEILQSENSGASKICSQISDLKETMSCEEVQNLLQSSKGIISCILEDMIEHQKEMEELEICNKIMKEELEMLKAKVGITDKDWWFEEIKALRKAVHEKEAEIKKMREAGDVETLKELNKQMKTQLEAACEGLKQVEELEKLFEKEHKARCEAERKLNKPRFKSEDLESDCCKVLQKETEDLKLQIKALNKLTDELKRESELLRELQQPCPDFSKELDEKCALENLLSLLQAELDAFKGQKLNDECEALRNELKRVLEQNCQLKALVNCYRQRLDVEKRASALKQLKLEERPEKKLKEKKEEEPGEKAEEGGEEKRKPGKRVPGVQSEEEKEEEKRKPRKEVPGAEGGEEEEGEEKRKPRKVLLSAEGEEEGEEKGKPRKVLLSAEGEEEEEEEERKPRKGLPGTEEEEGRIKPGERVPRAKGEGEEEEEEKKPGEKVSGVKVEGEDEEERGKPAKKVPGAEGGKEREEEKGKPGKTEPTAEEEEEEEKKKPGEKVPGVKVEGEEEEGKGKPGEKVPGAEGEEEDKERKPEKKVPDAEGEKEEGKGKLGKKVPEAEEEEGGERERKSGTKVSGAKEERRVSKEPRGPEDEDGKESLLLRAPEEEKRKPGEGQGKGLSERPGERPRSPEEKKEKLGEGQDKGPDKGPGEGPGEGPDKRPRGPEDEEKKESMLLRAPEEERGKPGEGQGKRPDEGPGERLVEKLGERLGEGPGERLVEKLGERLGEGPGERLVEKPGERLVEKPGERLGERPGERLGEKPVERPGEKLREETGKGPGEGPGKEPLSSEEEKGRPGTEGPDAKFADLKECLDRLKQAEAESAEKIKKLMDQHAKELKDQEKKYNDNLNAMKSGYETDIKKLAERHRMSMMRLQGLHEDEVQEMNTGYETQLETMQTQSQAAINEVAQGSAVKLRKLSEQHNREMKDMESKYQGVLEGLQDALSRSKQELETLKRKMQGTVLDTDQDKLKVQHAREMQKARKASKQKIDAMKELLAETKRQSEAEINALRQQFRDQERGDGAGRRKPKKPRDPRCPLDFNEVLEKILEEGMDSLSFNEIALVHRKTCCALERIVMKSKSLPGQLLQLEPPVRDTCSHTSLLELDRQKLLDRIFALEEEITQKQKQNQEHILSMEVAIKKERCRLQELRNTLQFEQQKNSELKLLLSSQTKLHADLKKERDQLGNQASLHQSLCEERSKRLSEEIRSRKCLEAEVEKLKSALRELHGALDEKRRNSSSNQKDQLEMMRQKLEQAVHQERRLTLQLEHENKCRREMQCQLQSLRQSLKHMVSQPSVENMDGFCPSPLEAKSVKEKQNLDQINEKKSKIKTKVVRKHKK